MLKVFMRSLCLPTGKWRSTAGFPSVSITGSTFPRIVSTCFICNEATYWARRASPHECAASAVQTRGLRGVRGRAIRRHGPVCVSPVAGFRQRRPHGGHAGGAPARRRGSTPGLAVSRRRRPLETAARGLSRCAAISLLAKQVEGTAPSLTSQEQAGDQRMRRAISSRTRSVALATVALGWGEPLGRTSTQGLGRFPPSGAGACRPPPTA